MQIVPDRAPTAPQAIRAFRMQSQQDAARLQAAGARQDFAATLQGLRPSPANMAGPGTPTGNTLAAMLQRLDTDQDGRITSLELRASGKLEEPPRAAGVPTR
ncbi:EF-hand domain-containing protein [Neoroseomonas rubea]|uniref:EF-hand domain-containing protein n=1 Tax=Neoroseomonas rubea TaxID=2748666 RepID=UPI0018DF3C6B|nr:EF-hand domain-containing protein [Roseomonas rubea]